jgi:hypothetical protein
MSDGTPTGATANVARQPSDGSAHNVVVLRTVELWFQKSPGAPGSEHREIVDLMYRLQGQTRVRTAANGKVIFRAPGGAATVELIFNNRVVASYTVTTSDAAMPAVTTVTGQQRRLRMLGYQLGHAGPLQNGVDGSLGSRTERSMLDYQADKGFAIVGSSNTETQNGLTNDVVTS